MIRNFWVLVCFLVVVFGATAGSVASIQFEGLTTTKESYLRKIILLKEGDFFDYKLLEKDVFLLRNLNLFFNVEGEAKEVQPDQFDIIFHIKEAKYLYPVFSISGFKDQLKLQAGANHINFLGRAQSFGGVYQFYDRHSFSLFHNAKRHSNNKTGHQLAIAKYSTVEPLYFNMAGVDTVSIFNFDNYSLSASGIYWLQQFLNVNVGGAYFYEDYNQRDSAFLLPGGNHFNFHKHQLKASLNFNRIENIYERQDGIAASIYGEWIHTYGIGNQDARFLKLLLESSWYKKVGELGNIALKGKLGISTNRFSPFAPFVLDGFLNVRGIGNRVERGTAEMVFNAEYRQTFWKHKIFTLQAAGFADYGTLRSPGQSFNTLLENSEYNLFLGGGLRFHLNVLYKTCLRVDYSVNPADPTRGGFTFGFGQFF